MNFIFLNFQLLEITRSLNVIIKNSRRFQKKKKKKKTHVNCIKAITIMILFLTFF